MTLFLHELRRSKLSLIIWSASLSFMLLICVIIYPEMKEQMSELSDMFANMGAFSDAFGMDMLMGDFLSYFALECGETLGIGGAVFAAIAGIGALSKEQRNRTAELLLTQPLSRSQVVTSKLLAVLAQLVVLNVAVVAVTLLGILAIGESADAAKLAWLFVSYFALQVEIALICFGISAFLRGGGIGIGLGVSLGFYFINVLANLSEEVKFLKYATPFAYTNGSYILEHSAIEWKYLIIGGALCVLGVVAAYWEYHRKDIL